MNHQSTRDLIISSIDVIIYFQLFLVSSLSLITICLMLYRRIRLKRIQSLKNTYALQFVEELLSCDEKDQLILLERPSKLKWLNLSALQETLLTQINTITGTERAFAVKRYFQLGFVKDDLELCGSFLWWKRLKGLSHLGHLDTPSLAKTLDHLRRDKNQLVSLYALLGLSSLDHELNNPELMHSLASHAKGLDNVFLEITRNWSRLFGIGKLVSFTETSQSVEFRNTFIAAICHIKTPESSAAISNYLETREDLPVELISKMILSIQEVGDHYLPMPISKYIDHENDLVRQRALEFLTSIDDDFSEEFVRKIKMDTSPGVRTIYQQWLAKKAA